MRTIKTQFVQDCAAERARQNRTAPPHKKKKKSGHTWHATIAGGHTSAHACARSCERGHYSCGGSLPWRIRRREFSAANEGDNKVRDHESCFWLPSSCSSLRHEESPDGNRRHKPGVHRHLLPLMSTANSKNYLAGLRPRLVSAATDNSFRSASAENAFPFSVLRSRPRVNANCTLFHSRSASPAQLLPITDREYRRANVSEASPLN